MCFLLECVLLVLVAVQMMVEEQFIFIFFIFFNYFLFICFLTKMCSAGYCRSADGGGGEVSDALQCPRARGCGLGRQVLKSW